MISAILKDSILETTTTTGTGTISLAGAQVGHGTFRSRFPDGAWVAYVIELRTLDGSGALTAIAREVGLGKLTYGAPDTLSRDHVLSSTNADALVNFAAGTKDVFCAPAAALFGWNLADVSVVSAAQTLNATHNGRLLLTSANGGAITQALPAVANVFAGYRVGIIKTDTSANAITVDPNAAETINGQTTWPIQRAWQAYWFVCNGSAWVVEHAASVRHNLNAAGLPGNGDDNVDGYQIGSLWFYGDALYYCYDASTSNAKWRIIGGPTLTITVNTTSGTSVDLGNMPAHARRITFALDGVSTNGSSNLLLQLGDAGGIETTGYTSAINTIGGAVNQASSTAGILLTGIITSTYVLDGIVELVCIDVSANRWVASVDLGVPIIPSISVGAGTKSLSGTLTQ